VIEGGGADDVELSDVDILNTARFGLLAKEGSSGFRLLRSNIYNCSYEEKGKFDGVRIEKAVSDWKIEDCWIGNRKDYFGVQRYGTATRPYHPLV
jgi:hypothetical protein